MTDLVLHAYDASPFTRRALVMLGIKRLAWRHVETPMMPPKDDLVALTGGYRGTPVLQIGADVYIDTQRIAIELERRHPSPSLFPAGDRGLARLAVRWADSLFRAVLPIAIEATSASWPEAFLADRRYLFPDLDFDAARRGTTEERARVRAHVSALEAQLADGRAFLTGAAPGLVDAQCWPFLWTCRAYFGDLARPLLAPFDRVAAWEARVAALGEGTRLPFDAESALGLAHAAAPDVPAGVDSGDPLGLRAGATVEVAPVDTRRGAVRGRLLTLTPDEVAVVHESPRAGEVVVHFPRDGYRITAV
jgi:glutathione S-transferase